MSMGYKGKLLIGTAGTTAATPVTNVQDVDYTTAPTKGDTSERGDGSAPVIEYEQVAALKPTITFKMREKSGDSNLTTLKTAAYTGAALAVRYLNASGGTGFDGDMTFEIKNTQPLKDTQMWEFTGTATNENRAATLNS